MSIKPSIALAQDRSAPAPTEKHTEQVCCAAGKGKATQGGRLSEHDGLLLLAHRPDDEDDGGEGHKGHQHRTADLVLFSFFREMAFEMVVAHGWVSCR